MTLTLPFIDVVLPPCDIIITLASRNYGSQLVTASERRMIMWHYDASTSDRGAVNWFQDPKFRFSYNRAYSDSGRRISLTPSMRHHAFHAGVCRTTTRITNANRQMYGLCVTAGVTSKDGRINPKNLETNAVVTMLQFMSIVTDTAIIARYHQVYGHRLGKEHARFWDTDLVDTWLTGHNEWAINEDGSLGRKVDPRGTMSGYEVLPINAGRAAVATLLDTPSHDLWQKVRFP